MYPYGTTNKISVKYFLQMSLHPGISQQLLPKCAIGQRRIPPLLHPFNRIQQRHLLISHQIRTTHGSTSIHTHSTVHEHFTTAPLASIDKSLSAREMLHDVIVLCVVCVEGFVTDDTGFWWVWIVSGFAHGGCVKDVCDTKAFQVHPVFRVAVTAYEHEIRDL